MIETITVEVVVEFPDLKPEDVTLLDELAEHCEESPWLVGWSAPLQDLRDRVARMLITAADKL